MFGCPMCDNPEETLYRQPLCSKCTEMKKIIDCYGVDSIIETLNYIYIRTGEPITGRRDYMKKKIITK